MTVLSVLRDTQEPPAECLEMLTFNGSHRWNLLQTLTFNSTEEFCTGEVSSRHADPSSSSSRVHGETVDITPLVCGGHGGIVLPLPRPLSSGSQSAPTGKAVL
ncbi:Hypothetical protein SMAX5B_008928 [Scophthalmus maximus]|uniref:Uncharacterized protein n=1 Tax=Scophthalmus maximus TaxID=52904 RepID=A0A2U9CK71_SCOMX|nr:Hypothetical protein SMAX5B_008928 [Scophthalmus maximus]